MLPDLKYMWETIDINPMDVHIRPQETFSLYKKYDVILITMSNIFWQADNIIEFTEGGVSQNSEVIDATTDKRCTFFTPYALEDIKFFVDNIKEWLEPGGIAVIQPYPFVYSQFDSFSAENKFLREYQKRDTGYETSVANAHSPKGELNDYFVVQNI